MMKPNVAVTACATLLWAGTVMGLPTPQENCDKARVTAWKTYVSCVDTVVAKDAGCMPTYPCPASFDEDGGFAKCRHTYFMKWVALQTKAYAGSTCARGLANRYTDNGDGTVTDNLSTLQWEQKTGTPGGGGSGTDQDNVNNRYQWSLGPLDTGSDTAADGAAFTTFLHYVAGGEPSPSNGCLGGQCDWRLPTLVELQTILLDFPCTKSSCTCGSTPCIDGTFGPTATGFYWSATSWVPNPLAAWYVDFRHGVLVTFIDPYGPNGKTEPLPVRAVRGGL